MRKLLASVLALTAVGASAAGALAAADPRPARPLVDLSTLEAPPRARASEVEAEIVRFRAVDQVAERRAQRADRAERRAAAERRAERRQRRAAAERRAQRRERREAAERRAERRERREAAERRERREAAERRLPPAEPEDGDAGGGASAALEAIAACESGGNPRAIGGGGAYRGKYQFSRETWAGVGGSGDPARASEAEQDRRAAILYARSGASSWPACGR